MYIHDIEKDNYDYQQLPIAIQHNYCNQIANEIQQC